MGRIFLQAAALALPSAFGAVILGSDYDPAWVNDRCTSIIVGAEASGDGGPVTSHTNDCNACDFRLSKVAAKDVDPTSLRPVYRYRAEYPRFLGDGKGETYGEAGLKSYYPWAAGAGDFEPMGYVEYGTSRTYAYVDGAYGMMNEHQVAIGESTCGARITALPIAEGGTALLEARELSSIALERCATARCAVELMGAMAEKYGFYGADSTAGEAGEALTVVDASDAWVFHVLADDSGGSAVWAARRVPPDSVAAVANQFVITTLPDDEEGDWWLASKNVKEVAAKVGLWDGAEDFDFLKAYGLSRLHLSPYATRRQWRVLDTAAPSLDLPGDTDEWGSDYPFSVKAEHAFGAAAVRALLRDHYEGTPYDMTRGLASGPHGDPNRFDVGATFDVGYAHGAGIFRFTSTWVFSKQLPRGKHLRFEISPRDDRSSKNQPTRVGNDRGMSLQSWNFLTLFPPRYSHGGDAVTMAEATSGMFERAISIFRCSYSFVSQSRGAAAMDDGYPAVLWVAQYAPHSASYVPVYVDADAVPEALATGSLHEVDVKAQYWAHALVGNWAARFWDVAMPLVAAKIDAVQSDVDAKRFHVEEKAKATKGAKRAALLEAFANETAAATLDTWWAFFWDLAATVKDGQRLDDVHAEKLNPTKLFYPRRWLDEIHFFPEAPQPLWVQYEPTKANALGYGVAFLLGAAISFFLVKKQEPKHDAPQPTTAYGLVN